MENVQVKKINAVKGFIGTTYAIYKDKTLIKIVKTKEQAEKFRNIISKLK